MDVATQISAPAQLVWNILTDTRLWPQWGPSLRSVDCADRYIKETSCGRVQTAAGIWLKFRISRFQPGCYWSWQVAGIPATGHRVEVLSPESCRLVFEVPLIAAPYAAICKVAAQRIAALAGEQDD